MSADMGQKQMRCTLPDQAAFGSVDMSRDEAVLVLLRHCQDMKRQETRLRLVSLLLLLSCAALFIFSQFQRNSGASGQTSAATPSSAYSKQDREYPEVDPQTDRKLRIDLTSRHDKCNLPSMTWTVVFGENYDDSKRAIVIPEDGIYLFYLRLTFRCPPHQKKDFEELNAKIMKRSEGSINDRFLLGAVDSVLCREGVMRTVSVMQLFDLRRGDQLSVSLTNGSELITDSSFGAFLT